MGQLGYKSLHSNHREIDKLFPSEYFHFLKNSDDPHNLFNVYIEKYDVFSDLPWYSNDLMVHLIKKYENEPNVIFVATTRNKVSWIKSIKKIKSFITPGSSLKFHNYEYEHLFEKFDSLDESELNHLLGNYYSTHYNLLKEICPQCTLLNLDNSAEIKSNMKQLFPDKADVIDTLAYPNVN